MNGNDAMMTNNDSVVSGTRSGFSVLPMSSEHGHGGGQRQGHEHGLAVFGAKGISVNDKNRDDDDDDFEAAMRSGGTLNVSSSFTIHHPDDEDDD